MNTTVADASCWSTPLSEPGPLGIDYLRVYHCGFGGNAAFALLLLVWIAIFIYFLGHTADAYFSPTLSIICEKLCLPLDIAGVTFLAFGNGAPDVFSSVASFSTAANPMIGVGALLGAGMFVTTVVVGVLCIISDVKISAAAFARDISFLILTLTWVVTVLFLGTVTLMQSLAFLLLYATYVGVAVTMWSCSASHSAADSHSDELPGAVMSAFWHTSTDLHIQEAGQQMVPFVAISNASKTAQYTFLISESDENAFDFDEDVSDDAEGPIAETEPSFRHTLVDDYFATASPESPTALRESLLANEERRELEGRTSSREVRLSSRRKNDSVPGSVLASLYWQRFRWQRRLRRSILTAEWWTKPMHQQTFEVLEFPIVLLRNLTIPTAESESWSKLYAVAQPILSPLFIIFASGNLNSRTGFAPIWALCLIVGAAVSVFVYLTTHISAPPKGRVYGTVWVLLSFIMCVTWIYLLASELVGALQALGTVMGITPSVLALTIMAWGNSCGDLMTNVSIARQGLGSMALAGSYGGPIFNLNIGLGLSLCYVCTLRYPEVFELRPDPQAVVSIVFLLCNLTLTVTAVWLRGGILDRKFGFFLIFVYMIYTLVQLVVVIITRDN